jgi:dTDP-glucose pyrophosphorylase
MAHDFREAPKELSIAMPTSWRQICIPLCATIKEAIQSIDEGCLQIALVVDGDRLCGTITDGDIRRAMLRGLTLNDPAAKAMNANPKTASCDESHASLTVRMRQMHIRQIPIVCEDNLLVGLEVADEIIAPPIRENRVILMAGGCGKRLSPLTDDCPKPMLHIGGSPILETALRSFIDHGFRNFSISVNYRAEQICNYFDDGARWGVKIEYLRESQSLGTAGALSLLERRPTLPFILMNGDILSKVNLTNLLDFHLAQNSVATMCVHDYEIQVPYGVVIVNDYHIHKILEKPVHKFLVNAGIYVFNPEILDLVPHQEPIDMTDLFDKVMGAKLSTAIFPIREYWMDIGRHSDLNRAMAEFEAAFR